MTELHRLGLAESGRAISEGAASSYRLVEALLERIERLEPQLTAWVTIDREGSLAAASALDKELESSGSRGPLHGVPVGLKDIFYTKDLKTTACSPIYQDFTPSYDATCVARLREAGMVVLGKTVTTEFATSDPSPTHNPWNVEHTPGGSSSGSAAAVAARMCAGALGSQTGGSTCRPAAYNGVVGLKPSYGRISRHGVIPVSWSLDTVGILVRSVEDSALLLQAMSGHDPSDPGSSTAPVEDDVTGLDHSPDKPRLGLLREFFMEVCYPEVHEHTESVVQALENAGAMVEEVELPESFETCFPSHNIVMNVECAAFHEANYKVRPDDFGPKLRANIETGMLVPAVHYVQSQRHRRRLSVDLNALAARYDALIMPSTPTPAPRDLNTTGDPVFQRPWTSAGLPTVSLPSGLSDSGLPLGVQLAGTRFGEPKLLAVARWCERVIGFDLEPPV